MARWILDGAHTLVEFSVKHLMITTVKGRFTKFEGFVEGDLPDLSGAQVEVSIDAASIDTREPQRDDHLRSPDFFDVARFPALTFKSRRITPAGEGEYKLTGDLTIHGVTREVTLDVTFEGLARDPWGGERAGFTAEGKINRKDFGLNWNVLLETGGVLVGEQVRISIQAELIKQAEAAA